MAQHNFSCNVSLRPQMTHFCMAFKIWCINQRFLQLTINNILIYISVMTVGIENTLLCWGLQIDSLVRHCGLLYVTDAQINLHCTQIMYSVSQLFMLLNHYFHSSYSNMGEKTRDVTWDLWALKIRTRNTAVRVSNW